MLAFLPMISSSISITELIDIGLDIGWFPLLGLNTS